MKMLSSSPVDSEIVTGCFNAPTHQYFLRMKTKVINLKIKLKIRTEDLQEMKKDNYTNGALPVSISSICCLNSFDCEEKYRAV